MSSFASVISALRRWNHHRTTEAYFVGYPKTGNTWIRFLLGRYLQQVCGSSEQLLFDAADRWGRCERACIGPAMQFTHRPLTWDSQTAADLSVSNVVAPFRGKKIVLLVRHPLDAEVSFWFQKRFRVAGGTVGELAEFLDDPVVGLDKCFRFHRLWHENQAVAGSFLVVKYEDMRHDPLAGFTRLLEFLGINIVPDQVRAAVDYASFDNMKAIEASGSGPRYRSSGLDIFATGDHANPDAFHVRKGKVGGYRDYLDAELAARLEERVRREMPWYDALAPLQEAVVCV